MDTKKLRHKILDFAIHGKLVPQDPNDEPASVLLERISNEKERLIKESKIKRNKQAASSDLLSDDVPFELPEGWCWTTIGNVSTSILYGVSESAKDSGNYRLLRITDIQDNKVDWAQVPFTNFDPQKVDSYLLSKGDILFARTGATVGKSYLVEEVTEPSIYASYLIRVQTSNVIQPAYVKRFFESGFYWNRISISSVGIGQPNVNGTTLSNLPIPIPPLAEQKRIVSAVEQWMSVIDVLENNEEDLRQSIDKAKSKILDLAIRGKLVPQDSNDEPVSDLLKRLGISPDNSPCEDLPFELPNSWCWTTLGNIFQHNTGKALNKSTIQEGELLPYITTSNVYWDRFELKDVRKMYFKNKEIEKCTVRKGDLLICEGGDIGRSAIWLYDYTICIQNHIHRLRPKFDVSVKLYYYVMMLYKRKNSIEGKGIGMLGLSSGQLDKLIVPLPPLAEQHRIVAKIEQLYSQLDEIESSLQS